MEDRGTKGGTTRRAPAKTAAASAPKVAAAPKAAAPKPVAPKKAAAVRKAAEAPAIEAPAVKAVAVPATRVMKADAPNRIAMVRMAAYFRAERRGFVPGYEVQDWLAAEAEIAERVGTEPKAT